MCTEQKGKNSRRAFTVSHRPRQAFANLKIFDSYECMCLCGCCCSCLLLTCHNDRNMPRFSGFYFSLNYHAYDTRTHVSLPRQSQFRLRLVGHHLFWCCDCWLCCCARQFVAVLFAVRTGARKTNEENSLH